MKKSIVVILTAAIMLSGLSIPVLFQNENIAYAANVESQAKYCDEKQKEEILETFMNEGYSKKGCAVLMAIIKQESNFRYLNNACDCGLIPWGGNIKKDCIEYVKNSADEPYIAQAKYMILKLKSNEFSRVDEKLRDDSLKIKSIVREITKYYTRPAKRYRTDYINKATSVAKSLYKEYTK